MYLSHKYATLHIILILVINIVALTITMSEEPLNRKDDVQEDVGDTAENVEDSLDEAGDKIKAEAIAVGNNLKDPDRDLDTEYDKEKIKKDFT